MGNQCCSGSNSDQNQIILPPAPINSYENFSVFGKINVNILNTEHFPDSKNASPCIFESKEFFNPKMIETINSLKPFNFDLIEVSSYFIPKYFQLSNEDIYLGTWLNKKMDGKCQIYHKNGEFYEGFITNGLKEGFGRLIKSNGDYYEGNFKNGLFHDKKGLFVYENDNKIRVIAEFKNGELEGYGEEIWSDGTIFKGNYIKFKKHGPGKIIWTTEEEENTGEKYQIKSSSRNQQFYEGNFKNDEFDGFGIYQWSNGKRYEGYWENGKMEGKGIFTWKDGRKYEGNFKEDNKEGYGEMKWSDGRIWKGNWKNNVQDGEGEYTETNGIVKKGVWRQGKRMSWIS